jgi:hypothetical protein
MKIATKSAPSSLAIAIKSPFFRANVDFNSIDAIITLSFTEFVNREIEKILFL